MDRNFDFGDYDSGPGCSIHRIYQMLSVSLSLSLSQPFSIEVLRKII